MPGRAEDRYVLLLQQTPEFRKIRQFQEFRVSQPDRLSVDCAGCAGCLESSLALRTATLISTLCYLMHRRCQGFDPLHVETQEGRFFGGRATFAKASQEKWRKEELFILNAVPVRYVDDSHHDKTFETVSTPAGWKVQLCWAKRSKATHPRYPELTTRLLTFCFLAGKESQPMRDNTVFQYLEESTKIGLIPLEMIELNQVKSWSSQKTRKKVAKPDWYRLDKPSFFRFPSRKITILILRPKSRRPNTKRPYHGLQREKPLDSRTNRQDTKDPSRSDFPNPRNNRHNQTAPVCCPGNPE